MAQIGNRTARLCSDFAGWLVATVADILRPKLPKSCWINSWSVNTLKAFVSAQYRQSTCLIHPLLGNWVVVGLPNGNFGNSNVRVDMAEQAGLDD